MKEVILDTETTGLEVKEGHRIVEIGCVELDNYVITSKKFHCYLNPERKVSEKALEVHGYTDEFLRKQKKFKQIVDDFLSFIEGKKLIIHNAPFDIAFINSELKRIQKPLIDNKFVVDSLEIARGKFPGTSNSLDNLCKRFNIDISKRKRHNALLDCELLREVYINLVDQKEPTLSLSEEVKKKDKVKYTSNSKKNSKLIVNPSEVEKAEHKKFLKEEMKKNFF